MSREVIVVPEIQDISRGLVLYMEFDGVVYASSEEVKTQILNNELNELSENWSKEGDKWFKEDASYEQ